MSQMILKTNQILGKNRTIMSRFASPCPAASQINQKEYNPFAIIYMALNKSPYYCKVYRIFKRSNVFFSDHSFQNERKKEATNLDLTWNRLKMLYEKQEYIRQVFNYTQESIQVLRKFPNLLPAFSSIAYSSKPMSESLIRLEKNENSKDMSISIPNLATTSDMQTTNTSIKTDSNEKSYNLPLIGGWRTKHFQYDSSGDKISTPTWTQNKGILSVTHTDFRVKQLLSLIEIAETVQSRLKRIEDLNTYLLQYPEAKLRAVKEGAIRKLWNVKRTTKDYTTHTVLRESFALLGHFGPLPCKGIRILTIDGGGIRGIVVIEMLKKLEQLTGKRIHELFDYICGVSTGSILVSCFGTPRGMSLDDAVSMYEDLGTKLFTQSALWGVSNLVLSRAYYDTTMFESLLKKFVGETPLIRTNRDLMCPRIAAVSTVMNRSSVMPFVFRNYSLPYDRQSQYLGSCKYSLFEAVRASGAAPTVFEEFVLDGIIHQDGGILVNNPCAVAIHEALLLWPDSQIQCVVSCGTGRHAPVKMAIQSSNIKSNMSSVSWKTLFNRILESATDTEGVHITLNDLLPANSYFRFNPYLSEMVPMHENKPEKISQLRDETSLYIRKNEEKFVDAAHSLLVKRTASQKLKDFAHRKAFEYGLANF